jgi:hypothetical protein
VGGGARASRDGGRTRKRMFLNVFEIGGCKGAVARAAETAEAAEAAAQNKQATVALGVGITKRKTARVRHTEELEW